MERVCEVIYPWRYIVNDPRDTLNRPYRQREDLIDTTWPKSSPYDIERARCCVSRDKNIEYTARFISPGYGHLTDSPARSSSSYRLKLTALLVLEPITIIVGAPDLFVNKGSTINLTCVVKYAPEPPPTMTWSHNADVSVTLANKPLGNDRFSTKAKNL